MWMIDFPFSIGDKVCFKKAGFVYECEWRQAMEIFHPMARKIFSTYDFAFHGVVLKISGVIPQAMVVQCGGLDFYVYYDKVQKE